MLAFIIIGKRAKPNFVIMETILNDSLFKISRL